MADPCALCARERPAGFAGCNRDGCPLKAPHGPPAFDSAMALEYLTADHDLPPVVEFAVARYTYTGSARPDLPLVVVTATDPTGVNHRALFAPDDSLSSGWNFVALESGPPSIPPGVIALVLAESTLNPKETA